MNIDSIRNNLYSMDHGALLATAKPSTLRLYPTNASVDESGISVYYAPFEFVNKNAKIVLIGITPGEAQMQRAWLAARSAMQKGLDMVSVMSEVKRQSSFNDKKGLMRPNLYAQLEHWGVPRWLNLHSGASLFEEGWSLVQTTSLLRFPSFIHGKNYEGKSPKMLKHPYLRDMIMNHLVPELQSIPNALLLPLGSTVEPVIQALYVEGLLKNPCIYGMLHPSGNNTYRLDYLLGDRLSPPPHRTNIASYDAGRKSFQNKYLQNIV